MELVAFRWMDAQLTETRTSVTNGMKRMRMSGVDTVVGLLVLCLSEVEPESKTIDTVSYGARHSVTTTFSQW